MRKTKPACTPADLADLIDLMQRVLTKLDECALGLPASYVQHALDHVRRAAA